MNGGGELSIMNSRNQISVALVAPRHGSAFLLHSIRYTAGNA